MKTFTVNDAKDLVSQAEQGDFLSKGKIIDIIRNAARKGEHSVTVKGIPEQIKLDLTTNHSFTIDGDLISGW